MEAKFISVQHQGLFQKIALVSGVNPVEISKLLGSVYKFHDQGLRNGSFMKVPWFVR